MSSVGTKVDPDGNETPVPFAKVFQPKKMLEPCESDPGFPATVNAAVPVVGEGTAPVPEFAL
jgi:hypothetical protein